jgi:hypothetical protein
MIPRLIGGLVIHQLRSQAGTTGVQFFDGERFRPLVPEVEMSMDDWFYGKFTQIDRVLRKDQGRAGDLSMNGAPLGNPNSEQAGHKKGTAGQC